MGSFSIWHWLIVLVVVVLIFGTKKLRNLGGDVGGAVKGFKDAMNEEKGASPVISNQIDNAIDVKSAEVQVAKVATKRKAPAAKKPAAPKTTAPKTAAKKTASEKTTVKKSVADKPAAKKTSAAKTNAAAKKIES